MMALRDPDIRLMLRVRDANDQAAFAELVERFQHRLVGVMNHLLGRSEEAEDLAQEVFLRVYRTRSRYKPTAKFSTWLFTIANNLALNALRDRQRKRNVPLEVKDSGPMPVAIYEDQRQRQPSHNLAQQELAGIVRNALDDLNERQRMAVVLNKFEDMGYSEIGEIMGMTGKAVKSLLSRARSKLREVLEGYIYMDGETPRAAVGDLDDE